jgi:hypothetical protein
MTEVVDMRFHTPLGIALGALWIAGASHAADDGTPPSTDSLAKMPANPVTETAPADNDASAATAGQPQHGRDKHAQQSAAASAAPAAGAQATSEAPGAAAATSTIVQPPAAPKKICRSMDVVGSKIPKRVCATPEEWASFNNRSHEEAQDGIRHLQNQGAVSPASPGVSPSQLPPGR